MAMTEFTDYLLLYKFSSEAYRSRSSSTVVKDFQLDPLYTTSTHKDYADNSMPIQLTNIKTNTKTSCTSSKTMS